VNELMEKSKTLNYTCRGLYFYSYYLKHKPKLYNFDENMIVDVKKKLKDITEFKSLNQNVESNKITSNFIITSNIEIMKMNDMEEFKELWISKTDDADIYNLYDNFNILTSNKIGIALVPTLKESIRLRELFKDKNLTFTIKFKCRFNEKFKKYQPIEQINL
jgi:hypothetical protein